MWERLNQPRGHSRQNGGTVPLPLTQPPPVFADRSIATSRSHFCRARSSAVFPWLPRPTNAKLISSVAERKTPHYTFHALRYSFAGVLANADVAAELPTKLTSHSSAAIQRGYTHHELAVLHNGEWVGLVASHLQIRIFDFMIILPSHLLVAFSAWLVLCIEQVR